jgi:hypothetical protein
MHRRTRDGLLQIVGFLVGGLATTFGGGALLIALAPWWGPAKWLNVAWLQAVFLFVVFVGGYLGLESASALAHIGRPGTWRMRTAVFLGMGALVCVWIAISRTAMWPHSTLGLGASLVGLAVIGVAVRLLAGHLGVWRLRENTPQS